MDIDYNSLTRQDILSQSLTSHKDQAQRWYGHVPQRQDTPTKYYKYRN